MKKREEEFVALIRRDAPEEDYKAFWKKIDEERNPKRVPLTDNRHITKIQISRSE
jgi:hypothetical protein